MEQNKKELNKIKYFSFVLRFHSIRLRLFCFFGSAQRQTTIERRASEREKTNTKENENYIRIQTKESEQESMKIQTNELHTQPMSIRLYTFFSCVLAFRFEKKKNKFENRNVNVMLSRRHHVCVVCAQEKCTKIQQ